jgi:hypothetical protein
MACAKNPQPVSLSDWAFGEDSTATPHGKGIRIGQCTYFRGVRWTSNGDWASLKSFLRLNVAREFKDFLGEWPVDDPESVEHHVMLHQVYERVGDSEAWCAVQWLVLPKERSQWLSPGQPVLSDWLTKDVPLDWLVGTLCCTTPRGSSFQVGDMPSARAHT